MFMGCSVTCLHACLKKKKSLIFQIFNLYSLPLLSFERLVQIIPLPPKYAEGSDWLAGPVYVIR